MKHIKTYEHSKNELQVGDYIIVKKLDTSDFGNFSKETIKDFENFLYNNIGKISYHANDSNLYDVKFDKMPSDLTRIASTINSKNNALLFYGYEIRLATKKDIKEIEIKQQANKYNL